MLSIQCVYFLSALFAFTKALVALSRQLFSPNSIDGCGLRSTLTNFQCEVNVNISNTCSEIERDSGGWSELFKNLKSSVKQLSRTS